MLIYKIVYFVLLKYNQSSSVYLVYYFISDESCKSFRYIIKTFILVFFVIDFK